MTEKVNATKGHKVIVGGMYEYDNNPPTLHYFCGYEPGGYGELRTDPSDANRFKTVTDAEHFIATHPYASSLSLIGKWEPKVYVLHWELEELDTKKLDKQYAMPIHS